MDTLNYAGYDALIELDATSRTFHGRVLGIRDVITFEGSSVDELDAALREAIDDYLEQCKLDGQAPAQPFSGEFRLRVGSELHRAIALRARADGTSINTWITRLIHADLDRGSRRRRSEPGV